MSARGELPIPDLEWPVLRPYWEAAGRRELRLPRCSACEKFNWYPQAACAGCGARDFAWVRLSGRAVLFSWAVVRRALHPALAPLQPYVCAIVQIEEDPDVRIVTRLLDAVPEQLEIGARLEVRFEDFGYPAIRTGVTGPFFIVRVDLSSEER